MTIDVLDPVVGAADLADVAGEDALEARTTAPAGPCGEEPAPDERLGRGGAPGAEPTTLVGDPLVDQAVFDAEFVALVLAEAPWGESEPSPAAVPPRAASRTRRAPPPGCPAEHSTAVARTQTATGVLREARRRPGPGPRSPPRAQSHPVWSTV